MAAVVSLCEANGFAASIKRSFTKDELDFPQRYDLECVHGWQKPTEKMGKRESVSARGNCPWSAYLRFYKSLDSWRFVMKTDLHSSAAVSDPTYFPISRHWKREDVREEIEGFIDGSGKRTCKDTARDISRPHPGVTITARDVQNIADDKRRQSLHGRTATQ